jgi:hypothetical protein
MSRAPAVFVGVSVALLLSLRADAQLPTLVVQGGTLIDGKGGSPISDAVQCRVQPFRRSAGSVGRLQATPPT